MGLWEFLDEIGEDVEDVADGMGQAANEAVDIVADGLEAVGLHSAAQAVDSFGDDVADTFGAQVGESQLGETEDATKLVHGDTGAIDATTEHLATFTAAFREGRSRAREDRHRPLERRRS